MRQLCILRFIACIFLSLWILSGCSLFGKKEKQWKPVKPGNQAFVHTVTWKKESFDILSLWYTGSKDNAETLINANPAVNPDNLQSGDLVFIPGNLLKTRKNLPEAFVENYYKKPKPPVKKPKPKPTVRQTPDKKEAEEFELFGPR